MSDSILVQNYFDQAGNPSIERMTFPDGKSLSARFIRDKDAMSELKPPFVMMANGDIVPGTLVQHA